LLGSLLHVISQNTISPEKGVIIKIQGLDTSKS
jgi:hypothetical protein